ncbi:MAG: Lrp/AsnC ligand binding domain-containing protein [DPANN group archaeon]|nr:Lrp/AsnC ligand binding domain-containing protein [DPANN group archaeon]
MAVGAYVLITTKSGSEKIVIEALKKMQEIKEARVLYGEYDILAKVQVNDIQNLNTFLLEKVRPIGHVEKTSTLIVAA